MPTVFPAAKLKAGMFLYEDIHFQGAVLLPRGTEVAERHLRQLAAWGVTEISVLGEVPAFDYVARVPGGATVARAPTEDSPAAAAAPAGEVPISESHLPTGRHEPGRFIATVSLGPAPGRTEFEGDFVVEGSISGAFELYAKGSIEVKGEVLGGRVVSRAGDVTVRGAILAKAPVHIEGGNLRLGRVEGAEIVARGRLDAEALVDCRTRAGIEVSVPGEEGLIRGGAVTASLRIACGVAGAKEGVPTEIVIPKNPDQIRYLKAQALERDLAARRAEHARIEKVLQVVRTLGDKVAALSPEKREEVAQMTKKYVALQGEIRRIETDLNMARAEAESDAVTMDRCPIAIGQVFPGVRVAIGAAAIPIGSKGENVGYYFKNGRMLVYVSTR